jgi:hypothetical protein
MQNHNKEVGIARAAIPMRIANVLLGAASAVELAIKVSDRTGVKKYGFAYDGAPVAMSGGTGKFFVTPHDKKLLEWVMVGDPDGFMKVTVSRNGETIAERAKSTIPKPEIKGYDALEIEVG